MSTVRKRHSKELRARAFEMRAAKQSLDEIARELSVSRSTVHYWLTVINPIPLTAAELKRKRQARDVRYSENAAAKRLADESKFHKATVDLKLSRAQKCRIAEAAVLFRLALRGYRILQPVFDGDKVDWLIGSDDSADYKRVQVKWMRRGDYGRPFCGATCMSENKRRRYRADEIDVLVGYDLYTDTAYVFTAAELRSRAAVSATNDAVERWDKLRG